MKKFFIVFIVIMITIVNIVTVFAGDIPETLISSDEVKIFYGKLVKVDLFGNEGETTVIPVKKIKGPVSLGKEELYKMPSFVGEFSANSGNVYLFVYINDDNPLYIFEPSSYDTKDVKLTGVSGEDMWQRFVGYLNEGKYEEAEKERQEKLSFVETETELTQLPPLKNYNTTIYAVVSIAVAAVAFYIYTKFSKKKM